MTIEFVCFLVTLIAFVNTLVALWRLGYWKGKYEELSKQDNSGWENEAKFWRLHFNKEAAEKAEELQ